MRTLLLFMAAAIGMHSANAATAVDECPLNLSLRTTPDAFVAKLTSMPSFRTERTPERKPLFGQCSYQASTLQQFAMPPNGLCSIDGQLTFGSMLEILDSESIVVSHTFMMLKSDQSLAALRSALGRIATSVSPQSDPSAWKTDPYTVIDGVYAHDGDVWTIFHKVKDPGSVSTAPDFYAVTHVRRDWLDFSRRDLNTCKEIPSSK
ncbi:hypothetical protein [Luteibacter sp.]|uniref:hypothetical protein n=1 Tax=Luteibacter sp. TaxID=1886636 RepID=UPI0025C345DD|nr:hypothetical protein [Luteibacter sp.]